MACRCGKDMIISESDIELTCDQALHNMFRKIDFILSVIGDDVKEYVRTYHEGHSKLINDTKNDQLVDEEKMEKDIDSEFRFPSDSSVSISYAGKVCSDVKLHRGPKRRHFSAAGGGSSLGYGEQMVANRLSGELLQKIRQNLLGSSGGADVSQTKGRDAERLHCQGQRAVKRSHASSEREERDCGRSRGKAMSDRRFRERFCHPVSPGGGALGSSGEGGGEIVMRSHSVFPEISRLLRFSKKGVCLKTTDSERNNNSPEENAGEREPVVVETLNYPL